VFDCVDPHSSWVEALWGSQPMHFQAPLLGSNKSHSQWQCQVIPLTLRTGHWSLSAVTRAPFHASVLRPASQVGPMHKAAGMRKLVNAALLSLINEACVSVCCATSSWVNSSAPLVCRHDRVIRDVGRVGLLLLLLLYRKRLTWHLVLSELQGHVTMSKS